MPTTFDAIRADEAETMSALYLRVEREHDREAVLEHRAEGKFVQTPDWRFHRQILRTGLYMGERLDLRAGDRVVLVSPLSVEALVVEWAAFVMGGVLVAIDPALPAAALVRAIDATAPRAVFAVPAALGAIRGACADRSTPAERAEVVELDGGAPSSDRTSLSRVLELGGTLDTAERAQGLRARARSVTGDMPALGFFDRTSRDTRAWRSLAHRDAVAHVRRLWAGTRAAPGDVAYIGGARAELAAHLALGAFLVDGLTRSVLGTPGREHEEIALFGPRWILGRAGVRAGPPPAPERPTARIRQWLASRAGTSRPRKTGGTP